ncbi:MAG: YfhO family protein, partial [Verrucomicrobiae bacterium]|nr:YfhO family protein [Verrucomicrobiae bacterium]
MDVAGENEIVRPADLARSLLTPGRFAVLLGVLVLASYWEVLFAERSFFQRDFLLFGYPLAEYHKTSLLSGEWPLWNPLSHCGLPYLAQWNTMVLYPGSLIYLGLPLPWSLNLFVVLHTYAAGLGMYFLTRHLTRSDLAAAVAAVAYTFGGLLQESLLWPNNIAAFGLLPWVLYGVDRGCREGGRWMVAGALTGGVQMLTGAAEVILFTWVISGLLTVVTDGEGWFAMERARIRRFVLVVIWVTALAAVQLFPFLELLAHSARATAVGTVHWPASVNAWVNLFFPAFETAEGNQGAYFQISQSWTRTFYPGLAVLLFGACALHRGADRRVPVLLAASLAMIGLAAGESGVLYDLIGSVLPVGVMRYPVKFLIFLTPVLPLLAAYGVREIERGSRRRNLLALGMVTLLGLAAFLMVMGNPDQPAIAMKSLARQTLVLGLVGSIAGGMLAKRQLAGALVVGLLLVQWCDLRWHLPKLVRTVEREALDLEIPSHARVPASDPANFGRVGLSHLARNALVFRHWPEPAEDVVMRRMHLAENLNLLSGTAKVGGFFSMWFHPQEEVMSALYSEEDEITEAIGDFLAIRLVKTFRNGLHWRERTNAMPLVTAGQRPVFLDGCGVLDGMMAADFDPRKTVFLPVAAAEA